MSLMHLFLITIQTDRAKFKEMYAPFAMIFNVMFLILANFTLIFGIAITLIFK